MNWKTYADGTHWTDDDRFCLTPLPEGWVAIDYGPAAGPHRRPLAYSDACDTPDEGREWCRERFEGGADPHAVVGG